MAVIAISGFPKSYALKQVFFLLKPVIGYPFEVLHFDPKVKNPKICYVCLSEDDNPIEVAKRIRRLKIGPYKLYPTIPPDISEIRLKKIKNVNQNIQQNFNFKPPVLKTTKKVGTFTGVNVKKPIKSYPIEMVVAYTHEQILIELQTKYSGLCELNKKTDNSLLPAIGQTVYRRLREISKMEVSETCMKLSRSYRKCYPHMTDFKLISTTLHRVQDELGDKRTLIQEKDLLTDVKSYDLQSISPVLLQETSNKYLQKIGTAIIDHVKNLSTEVDPSKDMNEEAARMKVKRQLKNMTPYLAGIVKSVVLKHLVPERAMNYVIKIYGEPCLPSRPTLSAWMRRYKMESKTRSDRMYNLALARIPAREMAAAMAANGTIIGPSKLVIRPADTPYVKVPISIQYDEI